MSEESREIGQCQSCQYEPVGLFECPPPVHWRDRENVKICEICYRSATGNAYFYNEEHRGLYQSVAWIGNRILAEIAALQSKG